MKGFHYLAQWIIYKIKLYILLFKSRKLYKKLAKELNILHTVKFHEVKNLESFKSEFIHRLYKKHSIDIKPIAILFDKTNNIYNEFKYLPQQYKQNLKKTCKQILWPFTIEQKDE